MSLDPHPAKVAAQFPSANYDLKQELPSQVLLKKAQGYEQQKLLASTERLKHQANLEAANSRLQELGHHGATFENNHAGKLGSHFTLG